MVAELQLNGQWIGDVSGDGTGRIIVNIDKVGSGYEGLAYLHDSDLDVPNALVLFRAPDTLPNFSLRAEVYPLDRNSEELVEWNAMTEKYPTVDFSKYADVKASLGQDSLVISWETNLGIKGSAQLASSDAGKPSQLIAEEKTWDEFKSYVGRLDYRRYIFRGQRSQWRLRTSFHRAGRAIMPRFVFEDGKELRRHLSWHTRHLFDETKPEQMGALYSLAQHHGYPTPILDWTYSPYVAAFFAYRGVANTAAQKGDVESKVRIHVFDGSLWTHNMTQPTHLHSAKLFVTLSDLMIIENPRAIPQQATSTITNVDDIESYIRRIEATTGVSYLTAIDLPLRERRRVMNELTYMGLSAGALFPGLDGVCEDLKAKNF